MIIQKYYVFATLFFTFLTACNSDSTNKNVVEITADNLTDYNVYLANLGKYDKKNLSKAEDLAKEAQKVESQPSKAMELYKQSIITYPNSTAYLGFGKSLAAQNGSISSVIGSLQMAEKLAYQPIGELYYEAAKQMVRLDSSFKMAGCEGVGDCLNKATQTGFKDVNRLRTDFISYEVLKSRLFIQYSNEYDVVNSYFRLFPADEKSKAACDVLNQYFRTEQIPYSIDEKNMEDLYNSTINTFLPYNLSEFLPVVKPIDYQEPPSVHPIAKLELDKNFYSYLYSAEEYEATFFYLTTYSTTGKLISSQKIAAIGNEKLQTCVIMKNKIDIKKHKINFDKLYNDTKTSFSIKNKEFIEATSVKIENTGAIVE